GFAARPLGQTPSVAETQRLEAHLSSSRAWIGQSGEESGALCLARKASRGAHNGVEKTNELVVKFHSLSFAINNTRSGYFFMSVSSKPTAQFFLFRFRHTAIAFANATFA